MTQRPVLETKQLSYGPVSEWELDIGVEWAKKEYGRTISRNLLRIIFNTTEERRVRGSKLPLLVATVVREAIPPKNKEERHKIDGYKGAAMKIFAERSARGAPKRAREARAYKALTGKKKPAKKQDVHPEDPKKPKQLLLF